MKRLFAYITIGLLALFAAAPVVSLATPAPQVSAACAERFLGIPTWYRDVVDSNCNVEMPNGTSAELGGFIWKIVLNIIEMVLVIVVYVAVAFILYGGFLFISGGGNPSQIEKARKSILNAVIGLVIALAAIAIVNFIFGIVS